MISSYLKRRVRGITDVLGWQRLMFLLFQLSSTTICWTLFSAPRPSWPARLMRPWRAAILRLAAMEIVSQSTASRWYSRRTSSPPMESSTSSIKSSCPTLVSFTSYHPSEIILTCFLNIRILLFSSKLSRLWSWLDNLRAPSVTCWQSWDCQELWDPRLSTHSWLHWTQPSTVSKQVWIHVNLSFYLLFTNFHSLLALTQLMVSSLSLSVLILP